MSEVENVISSFEPQAPVEAVASQESPKPEPTAVEEQAPESQEEATSENESSDDFKEWDAKRAKNRISRQDKRIAKLTWEKHQYEQKLAELQAQPPKTQQAPTQSIEGGPKEEDYAGRFDEFIVAKAAFEAKQAAKSLYEEERKQASQAAEHQQYATQIQQMVDAADKATERFVAEVPDAITAKQEFEEMANDLPPQTLVALMSLGEQAPKAIYQLWKADKFDDLVSANPMQAQILIASALATPFTKPVTKAPAPVRSAKGTVQSVSLPDDPGELLKLIRKR